MSYPTIDFMNDMRNEFGGSEFRVTLQTKVITSREWPLSKWSAVNRPDSEYVTPSANHNEAVKND